MISLNPQQSIVIDPVSYLAIEQNGNVANITRDAARATLRRDAQLEISGTTENMQLMWS